MSLKAELVAERERLQRRLAAIETLLEELDDPATPPALRKVTPKKRGWTEAQRKAQRDKMREYWAAKRAKTGKKKPTKTKRKRVR